MTNPAENEATIRLKINKMLEMAGWRLVGRDANVKVEQTHADYILFDSKSFPLCILEAKRENINPLSAKEQARMYAEKQNVRFVILSNGEIFYLWEKASPRSKLQGIGPYCILECHKGRGIRSIKIKRDFSFQK